MFVTIDEERSCSEEERSWKEEFMEESGCSAVDSVIGPLVVLLCVPC